MINRGGFGMGCAVFQVVTKPALLNGDREKQINVSQIPNTVHSVEACGYIVFSSPLMAGCSPNYPTFM
jgi:hypothetical protein